MHVPGTYTPGRDYVPGTDVLVGSSDCCEDPNPRRGRTHTLSGTHSSAFMSDDCCQVERSSPAGAPISWRQYYYSSVYNLIPYQVAASIPTPRALLYHTSITDSSTDRRSSCHGRNTNNQLKATNSASCLKAHSHIAAAIWTLTGARTGNSKAQRPHSIEKPA